MRWIYKWMKPFCSNALCGARLHSLHLTELILVHAIKLCFCICGLWRRCRMVRIQYQLMVYRVLSSCLAEARFYAIATYYIVRLTLNLFVCSVVYGTGPVANMGRKWCHTAVWITERTVLQSINQNASKLLRFYLVLVHCIQNCQLDATRLRARRREATWTREKIAIVCTKL